MLRIVVVEDEALVRRGIVEAVDWAALGCAVVGEAADGAEGLACIRTLSPDLIICDIRMPKLSGIEMVQRLRDEGNTADVIFLTAYSDFSYAREAVRLQAADYLLKPFHDDDLEQVVQKIKKRRQEKTPRTRSCRNCGMCPWVRTPWPL